MARFCSLPHAVQVHIFGLLPLDTRFRCMCVCRAWKRVLLLDAAAWKHLTLPDFEFKGLGDLIRVFGLAVAHAQGALETLDVSSLIVDDDDIEFLDHTIFGPESDAQPRLRELRLGPTDFRNSDEILHILGKAPQLELLAVASKWSHFYDRAGNRLAVVDELYRGAVRIRTLGLDFELDDMDDGELQAVFTVIRRVVGQLTHPEFSALHIDFDILNDTIVDFLAELAAAHEPPLCVLGLEQFNDWPGVSVETTVRLLRLNVVRHFTSTFWVHRIMHDPGSDDAEVWTGICAAVRDCTSLHTVLVDPRLVRISTRAFRQFTAALAGHLSIARIQLDDEPDIWPAEWLRVRRTVEYGRGIAQIVAANAPALQRLYVCDAALAEDGMGLLLAALPRNTHLRQLLFGTSTLFASDSDDPSPLPSFWRTDYIKDRFIPALQQMRGLRELTIDDGSEFDEYSAEDLQDIDLDDCDEYELARIALQEAVLLVRERSDPKVLAAARAAARDWQRAYRRWTSQP